MIKNQNTQRDFSDLPFSEFVFNEEHPLLKLEKLIDWSDLLEKLSVFYHKTHGRPSTFLRAQTGTLILKFLKDHPDRETVGYVEESIYAQRLCGLYPAQAQGYMHPASGLTQFRAKIGPKGMEIIQEALNKVAIKASFKKGGKMILDTTCVPMDLIYPTDTRLLEKCRRLIMKLFKEAKSFGVNLKHRTYNHTARKFFVTFSKFSKPSKKKRQKAHKKMFRFVRRNLKQLTSLKEEATCSLGKLYHTDIKIMTFFKKLKDSHRKIQTILHQQKKVIKKQVSIPHRIISLHKDHIRPIVRGKFPVNTEFGPKILVCIVKGITHVIHNSYDNISDTKLIVPALRWFKSKFGRFPKEVLGDRGFYSQIKVKWLRSLGIKPGLQHRGRSRIKEYESKSMVRRRVCIEAAISLGKRKFGWGRCRARIIEHETSWIGLGAAVMNCHKMIMVKPP